MNASERLQSGSAIRVLQVSAELFPWLKTGGLADVAGALPVALAAQDVEMRALVPGFSAFLKALVSRQELSSGWTPWGDFLQIDRVVVDSDRPFCLYLIIAPALYERAGTPYEGEDGDAFSDNHRRFASLCWAAKMLADGLDADWQPSLVHAHDWHAALTPLYLRYHRAGAVAAIPCLLTIHNLAYQGLFDARHLDELAIPQACWHPEGVEFHGQLSMLKAGIVYADRINTVSPGYAREIQGPQQGCGLDGLLRHRAAHLSGILNGIDDRVWDPSTDPCLAARYSRHRLIFKKQNHRALEVELGLEAQGEGPRCALISRLTVQKGLWLILEAAAQMMQDRAQLIVLGSGDRTLEQAFKDLQRHYPGQISVRLGFDEALAHRMIAGSDLILVPSLFEPCGLTQMYGMRYGCLPLVHLVGGLSDTVQPWSLCPGGHAGRNPSANGFGFSVHRLEEFLSCWREMLACWRDQPQWHQLQRQAMSADLGWDHAASEYADLYRAMLVEACGSTAHS